jgi:phosphotransferase family enzyme
MSLVPLGPRLPSASAHWESAEFRAELTAWIASEVGEPSALEAVKIRAWASVWRAGTPSGVQYAKQNCSTQPFEAALLCELVDLAPQHVVPLTAADPDRGLLMTPDQGPVLGETAGDDPDVWCRVVAAGAALQREVAPYVDRLAAAGVPTLAPADSVAYVEQRLDEFTALPQGDPRAMSAEDRTAIRAHLPVVRGWVEQVAALGLPLTLVHNDLHGNNVFDRDGGLRFFDFGDAMLMEPLAVLMVPLNVLTSRLEAAPDDPRLRRVADAGLEVWSDLAPVQELRAALPAALQLARLGRVDTWIRCTAPMNDAELEDWGDSAAFWLSSLLLRPLLADPAGRPAG